MGLNHSTLKSFKYAIEGIKTAYKQEPNLRIHTAIGFCALVAGYFLKLSSVEWLILILTIFMVITLELINTVLEALVDLHSPEIKNEAKVAKDVSAAVVLVASVFAIIVGVILFLPKFISLG